MGISQSFAACTGFSNKREWEPSTDLPDLSGKVSFPLAFIPRFEISIISRKPDSNVLGNLGRNRHWR